MRQCNCTATQTYVTVWLFVWCTPCLYSCHTCYKVVVCVCVCLWCCCGCKSKCWYVFCNISMGGLKRSESLVRTMKNSRAQRLAISAPVNLSCSIVFSQNALVHRLAGNGNGYRGCSSVWCCTIRLVPFALITLTLSRLACDTSNAGAFLRHLIDQNKHIILW